MKKLLSILLCLALLCSMMAVTVLAFDARNEKDNSDGDGNPCHRLLAILHEKGSHDNGAESSENAALEYFHVAKVIKSCYQRSFGGEFFNILNVKYD